MPLLPHLLSQVIRRIISQTERFNAPDVFQGLQDLSVLKAKVRKGNIWCTGHVCSSSSKFTLSAAA